VISGSYQGAVFDPMIQKSRAGLLLLNGRVYVGFGAFNKEWNNYHGWIFSFDASKLTNGPVAYSPTPNYPGGGIWQSGNGLTSDGAFIYVNTGNGSNEGLDNFQNGQLADSVLKLNPDLTLAQSYTPPNVMCLDTCDLDLGSAGPVLFPNSDTLLSGGKEGIFYVFSRNDISKLTQRPLRAADQKDPRQQPLPYCSCLATDISPCQAVTRTPRGVGLTFWEAPDPRKRCGGGASDWMTVAHGYSNIHGSPVVLPSALNHYQVYVWPEENELRMFRYSGGQLLPNATLATGPHAKAPPSSMPGGILSLTATPNGTNGIVWGTVAQDCSKTSDACYDYAGGDAAGATAANVPGVFAAFDASTLAELWSDTGVGCFAKFSPPTIANGKVYVANFGELGEGCGGGYGGLHSVSRTAAPGHVRVYGLRDVILPIELTRWPYTRIDPGPLTPGEREELQRLRRGD
jgi:hypothetical protein